MTVYVKYSRYKPHLPEAIADTDEELAAMVGKSVNVIRSSISHGLQTYQRVEIDSETEEEC